VERLLFRMGLRFQTTVSPPRGHSGEAYVINISTVDMYDNLDKLTCIGSRESGLINEFKKQAPNKTGGKEIVPLTYDEAAFIAKLAYAEKKMGIYAAARKFRKSAPRANMYNLRKLLDTVSVDERAAWPALYKRVYADGVKWEPVTKVTELSKRTVYDFIVEGTKVFVTGTGLVVYDTASFYVPVSDRAVREAKEKMVPSKNLLGARWFRAHYVPEEDYVLGLHLTTNKKKGSPKAAFKSEEDAIRAYRQGKISIDDNIQIVGG